MQAQATATLRPKEKRTVERFVELLKDELGPQLHAIWLFGSRARGEPPHPESDVDLIVLTAGGSDQDSRRAWELLFEAAEAEGADGPYFSIHVRDLEWIEERRAIEDFFIQEVDRDKLVFFERP